MRSDNNQLDIFKHDPRITAPKLAKAFRAAAETALKDVQFSVRERQERHDYYLSEAKRHEAVARNSKRRAGRRRATNPKETTA